MDFYFYHSIFGIELRSMNQESRKNTPIKLYITGFVLSLLLTLLAYLIKVMHMLDASLMQVFIIILAMVQLIVQLFFFLHLGEEKKPRWNLQFLISTVGIILLVVIASLWIMSHLNYNMTPKEMNKYTQSQDGI